MLSKVKTILSQAHTRKSFFLIIATIYPTLDWRYKLIEEAYKDAKEAFRNKKRESGERYFEHLRAVALILILYLRVKDYRMIIAALLHDIVEDTYWTIEMIRAKYGNEIAFLVECMTKPKDLYPIKEECEAAYHERFEQAKRRFFLLKLADRLHNILTMWACTLEKRARKIEETRRFYLPFAEKHFILYHELVAAIDELLQCPCTEQPA